MKNFSARETEWLLELDGIELAGFMRRALAFLIDLVIAALLLMIIGGLAALLVYLRYKISGQPMPPNIHVDIGSEEHPGGHLVRDILIPVSYFGILTWHGKGRSPGKRLMKIRVVSLMHRHLSLWHSIERALGYGAALLEGGFGFFQYFLHPYRRTVQDRIAETIVVTERSYSERQHKLFHPLLPDNEQPSPGRVPDDSSLAGLPPSAKAPA